MNSRTQPSGYFFRVAGFFRIGKYLCILLFALFMIMMLFVYRDKITYNNFSYMLKDIDAAVLLRTDASFATVTYQTSDPTFESLNGNLVIGDRNAVTLYNPAGIEVYSIPFSGQNIRFDTDGKFLLAYDPGGKAFLLCNSITKLVSGEAKGTICVTDVGKSGAFALALSSNTTRYTVDVYNSSFSHSATYGVNDYVIDVSVSDSGDGIAILTFTGEGDVPDTTLRIGAVGEESYRATLTHPGEFPVSVDWQGNSIVLQTDASTYFYTAEGTLISQYSIGSRTLVATSSAEDVYAVATAKNGETVVTIFDRSGYARYNEKTPYRVRDLAFCTDGLLILSADHAVYISLDNYLVTEVSAEDALCILGVEDYGLICSRSRASAIFIETKEEEN